MMITDVIGLFLLLAGFVVGLGAVSVIDLHGLLGRSSPYWTEATIRTHKVTKPMIWVGIFLAMTGGVIFYRNESLSGIPLFHLVSAIVLILNGLFLSFWVSPRLISREKEGRARDLLPREWQRMIAVSLIISDFGWWGSLLLLVIYILK